MNLFFDAVSRSTLALGASWLVANLLRRASADLRHYVWLMGLVMAALSLAPVSAPPPLRIVIASVPSVQAASASLPATWNGRAILLSFWAAGCLLLLIRLALDLYRLADVTRKGRRCGSDGIRWSDTVAAPMTWGVHHPVVLLPANMELLGPESCATAILHEQAHIARKDWVYQIFARLITAILWFQPLAWLAAAQLRAEAERAADDLVLAGGCE